MKRLKWRNIFILFICLTLLVFIFKFFDSDKKQAAEPSEKQPEVKIQYDQNYKTIEINSYTKDEKHGGYWTSYPILPDEEITAALKNILQAKLPNMINEFRNQMFRLRRKLPYIFPTRLRITANKQSRFFFETFEYITGPKGNLTTESLTFDLQTHKQLSLKDIFQEKAIIYFSFQKSVMAN